MSQSLSLPATPNSPAENEKSMLKWGVSGIELKAPDQPLIYKRILLHIEYLWHVDPQQKNGPEADEDHHSCESGT